MTETNCGGVMDLRLVGLGNSEAGVVVAGEPGSLGKACLFLAGVLVAGFLSRAAMPSNDTTTSCSISTVRISKNGSILTMAGVLIPFISRRTLSLGAAF